MARFNMIILIYLFLLNQLLGIESSSAQFYTDNLPLHYFVNGTNLQGQVAFFPAFFSFPMLATKSRPLLMINSNDDPLACSKLNYKTTNDGVPFADNFVLISVSPNPLCAITTQLQNAMALGVAAIIMFGCSPNPPTNCDPTFIPIYGAVSIPVPVIFTRSHDGAILADYISNHLPSVAPLNTTIIGANGPTSSVDKHALINLTSTTNLNSGLFQSLYGLLSVPIYATSQILDPNFDPCFSYLAGAWCENGRIVFLWATYLGISGYLPPAFGLFSALRFIEFGYNFISDITPLCQIHTLRYIGIESNQLAFLPDCFDGFPNFGTLYASNNQIVNFPNSFLKVASNMATIALDNNQVKSFPSFSSFINLRVLMINNNGGSGTISSFKNFQYLTTLDMHSNNLSGCIQSDYFDGLSAIQKLDLSYNSICGPLPNLVGSGSKLTSLSIHFNSFSSPIPTSWSGLSVLLTLKANNNRIVSPIDTLSSLSTVTSIDLSYNFITALTSNPADEGKVGRLIATSAGSNVAKLNLNNNLIAGLWSTYELLFALKGLVQLSLSNNAITSLPSDIFDPVFSPPNLVSLDVSNNQLTGPFPGPVVPSSSVSYLNFQGNPNFHGALPSWAVLNSKSVVLIDRFLCLAMTSTTNPFMTLLFDPGYANYAGCTCNNGFYGTPPNCLNIPSLISPIKSSNPGEVTAFVNPNVVYSDSLFGNQRYSSGMDTSWQILPPFAGSPVRVITITFNFYSAFHSVTDSVTIVDTQGRLLGSVTGTGTSLDIVGTGFNGIYPQSNKTMVSLVVYDVGAKVNFKTIDTNGLHMDFSYTMDYTCPDDTGVSPSSNQCVKWFVVPTFYQYVVYLVSGVVSLFIVCVTLFVFRHRSTLVIKSASVPFCLMILFFMLVMAVGASFWAYQPSLDNSAACHIRPWFLGVGVVGVLASLTAKANRIRLIFNNVNFKEKVMTNAELLRMVGAMMAIEFILLIAFSASSFSKSEVIDGSGFTTSYLVKSCYSPNESNSYLIWLVIQFAYVAGFLIAGLYIAFGIRNVPSAYNESSHIVNCLVCLLTLGVIVILIQFLIQDNPNASAILRGLGQAMVALVLTLAIFGPKIYSIIDGRGDDPSQIARDTFRKRSHTHVSGNDKLSNKSVLTNLSDQVQKLATANLNKLLANSENRNNPDLENCLLTIKEMVQVVNEAVNKVIPPASPPSQPPTTNGVESRSSGASSAVKTPRSRPQAGSVYSSQAPLGGGYHESDRPLSPINRPTHYINRASAGSSTSNLQLGTITQSVEAHNLVHRSTIQVALVPEDSPEGAVGTKTTNKI